MAADITVGILRDIRDWIQDLRGDINTRIDALREDLNTQIDALRTDFTERQDQTNGRLGRVEHGLNDLGRFMRQIALDQARHERFHAQHVERLESDVGDLEERVQRLEARVEG